MSPTKLARRRKSADQVINEPSAIVGLRTGRMHAMLAEAGQPEMIDIEPMHKYARGGTARVNPNALLGRGWSGYGSFSGGGGSQDPQREARLQLSRTYLGARQGALGEERADYAALQAARGNAGDQQAVALARRNQAITDRDYGAYGIPAPIDVNTPVTPGAVGVRQRIRSQADILEEQLADRARLRGFGLEEAALAREAGSLDLEGGGTGGGGYGGRGGGAITITPAMRAAQATSTDPLVRASRRRVAGYQQGTDEGVLVQPRKPTKLAKKKAPVHSAFVNGQLYEIPQEDVAGLSSEEITNEIMQGQAARTAKRQGKVAYTDPFAESALPEYLSPRQATERKMAASERQKEAGKAEIRQRAVQRYGHLGGIDVEPDEWENFSDAKLLDLATTREEIVDPKTGVKTAGAPLLPPAEARRSLLKRGYTPREIDVALADAKMNARKKASGSMTLADLLAGKTQ